MKLRLAAALPALALTLALAPDGAGEAPPPLGAAIAEQRNLASTRPSDAGVWNDLGNLLVLAGNLDEADGAYARALEIDPGSVQAHFNLGLLRQQRGDLEGAVSEYHALLDLEPRHARALYQLGAACEDQGLRELALEHYADAFTLDPELLFAENNPHIIENRLVTEALLLARRGSRSGPPTPRSYDEEARINSLLEPPAPTLDDVEPEPAEDADEADSQTSDDDASAVRDQIGRGAARRGRGEPPATATVASGKDRVLDTTDLRGSVRNQVQGDPDGGGASAAANSRRRSTATVTPQGGRRPAVSQPPADGSAFGFGQRSTGALEWKLGPASDEPVPAR